MCRTTRARYHRAIRHIEKNANTIRMGKMANALLSNKSRDVCSECAKMKGKNCKMASMIDGNSVLVVLQVCFLINTQHCITLFLMIIQKGNA